MSLILDALRKSEAERRRGQAPDLHATGPAPLPHASASVPRWWPVAAVALLLAALAGLWWPRADRAPTPVSALPPADSPAVPASAPEDSDRSDPPAMAPAGPPVQPVAVIPTPTLPAPAPASPDIATGTLAPGHPASPPASAAPPAPAPPSADQAPPAAASAVPAQSDAEVLPPLAVLPVEQRATLPPLKLSVHVWNSDAGKRFAIIDGQRVGEGATLGSGVIEEIRRDGVVLNLGGRRYLLSRP